MTLHSLSKNIIKRVTCRRCGISRAVPIMTKWTSDGIITHQVLGFVPPPSIIIETEEYRYIEAERSFTTKRFTELICGKVLGYYESLMGRKGEIEWAVLPEEWALEINVTPP